MVVIDRRRVRQTKLNTIIVHRRKGNKRIRSNFDIQYNGEGKWATVCSVWTTFGVNVTTDDSQVTCMHCLKRMGN